MPKQITFIRNWLYNIKELYEKPSLDNELDWQTKKKKLRMK